MRKPVFAICEQQHADQPAHPFESYRRMTVFGGEVVVGGVWEVNVVQGLDNVDL